MLQLQNKLITLLCAVFAVSCGFMDLRPIDINIVPGEMNELLPDQYSPVIIKFGAQMNKNEAEEILHINSDYGNVSGDKHWIGNNLYFVPVSGWTAGIRYSLNLNGVIRSIDGRELRVDKFVPFYAINKNKNPFLESYNPPSGASVGTNDVTMEFYFSETMDRFSVESALVIEGAGTKNFEWFSNDQFLKVTFEKALSPWIIYNWTLKETAKSIDGVPLSKTYSDFFASNLDQILPEVTGVYPVLFSEGRWHPTGMAIETYLNKDEGIAVSFNKKMGENVLRSIRFDPSLSGRTEFLSETSIVYIFSKNPEPETSYTMTISGDTKDSEGLKIGSDYKVNFVPDIPFLKIISIRTDNETVINNFCQINEPFPININPASGDFSFSIYFSLPFSFDEKIITAQKISLTPFFPRTISPVALQFVNWVSDDRLYMRWKGLKVGENDTNYYLLKIPGGKGGVSSNVGVFLKEDIEIILEVNK